MSNRFVLCMVFIISVDILVYIGEILINLQYFLRFNLYILWNLWNPYYLSFSGILSLVCVQVGSDFRSQREGSVFVYLFSWNNWYYLPIHSFMLHCPLIQIWFFDLVCLDFNPNITFKSSVYCKSSDFLQYFWGFHPWILLNLWICQIYSFIVWFLQYQGNFRFCNSQIVLKW